LRHFAILHHMPGGIDLSISEFCNFIIYCLICPPPPSPPFFHVDIKIGSYMGKLALIYYFSACRDFLLCFLIEDFLNGGYSSFLHHYDITKILLKMALNTITLALLTLLSNLVSDNLCNIHVHTVYVTWYSVLFLIFYQRMNY
jgi:hypothetical protein